MTTRSVRVAVGLLLALGLLASCATYRYGRQATDAVQTQNWDGAVYFYLEALARDPGNVHYKMALERARLKAGEEHFQRGMRFKQVGELQRAESEFELAVQFDPTHQYAQVELAKVQKDLAILDQEGGPSKLAEIKKAASEMKVKPPVLNPASDEPMSLSFPNPTNVRDIYKAIGQAFGINILFDNKMRDQKLSIELKNVTAREALESVMQAAGHFYKVLDPKTVIVVEDTPQNRRDYEDLVVKTFFLSNADVKDISNMLRALIDARRIAINEQLNSLVIRDTADKVAIAERLIDANDKAKAEVLVDVELMQVDTNKLRDIGMSLSSQTFHGQPRCHQARRLDQHVAPLPEPAREHLPLDVDHGGAVRRPQPDQVGRRDRDPRPAPAPHHGAGEGEPGHRAEGADPDDDLQHDADDRRQHRADHRVQLPGRGDQARHRAESAPQQRGHAEAQGRGLGPRHRRSRSPASRTSTRSTPATSTPTIRLKDGETSLLAGLLKETKATSNTGLPWLSDIPLIGRLFSDTSKQVNQTDLILTLTPHIIRYPDITEEDLAPLWVGTENRVTIFGNSPRVQSAVAGNPLGGVSRRVQPGFGPGWRGGGAASDRTRNVRSAGTVVAGHAGRADRRCDGPDCKAAAELAGNGAQPGPGRRGRTDHGPQCRGLQPERRPGYDGVDTGRAGIDAERDGHGAGDRRQRSAGVHLLPGKGAGRRRERRRDAGRARPRRLRVDRPVAHRLRPGAARGHPA